MKDFLVSTIAFVMIFFIAMVGMLFTAGSAG